MKNQIAVTYGDGNIPYRKAFENDYDTGGKSIAEYIKEGYFIFFIKDFPDKEKLFVIFEWRFS